jgi:iron complex transport system ATP-binding protein
MNLDVNGLCFSYADKPVLKGLSLSVSPGKIMSLVGPNGSGKTTLLKCIANLHKAQKGSVRLGDTVINSLNFRELAKYIGYVPQDTGLAFPMSVIDAVLLGRSPHVSFRASEADMDIALEAMSLMGLEAYAFSLTNELSGGERQRVFIARALAQEPKIMLLDEPTSNLDLKHQLETLQILRQIAMEKKLIVIMAIHDLNLVARFSDVVTMLKNGTVLAEGIPADVINARNVRNAYGVEAVVRIENGLPFVIPVRVR